ncbi:hypothetical protein [Laspinema palackyanum]|uniref:hypothetical protein n=1 Tax=Laspinema palackyanum TaxID=3231601 RepID=UPI00345C839E
MANSDNPNEFVETTTRVYLQREDARQSSFERAFPLLILAFMVAGMVALTANQGSGPSTINNNHHIEVTK